jgi:hypothetical protein
MEEAGVQLLMNAGIKRAAATKALLSFSRQVLDNYEKLGPHYAWTGCSLAAIMEWWPRTRTACSNAGRSFWGQHSVSRLAARVLSEKTGTTISGRGQV